MHHLYSLLTLSQCFIRRIKKLRTRSSDLLRRFPHFPVRFVFHFPRGELDFSVSFPLNPAMCSARIIGNKFGISWANTALERRVFIRFYELELESVARVSAIVRRGKVFLVNGTKNPRWGVTRNKCSGCQIAGVHRKLQTGSCISFRHRFDKNKNEFINF